MMISSKVKMASLTAVFFSVLGGLSASSLVSVWVWMELNSLLFLMYLLSSELSEGFAGPLKYFVTQSYFSVALIIGLLWIEISESSADSALGEMLICLSVMGKLGMAPFMGWVLHLSKHLGLEELIILFSVQKILPLILSSYCLKVNSLMFLLASLGFLVSSVAILESNYVVNTLTWGSIFSTSWLVVTLTNLSLGLVYLGLTGLSMYLIVGSVFKSKELPLGLRAYNLSGKMMAGAGVVSLVGFPPSMLFFTKVAMGGNLVDEKLGSLLILSLLMSVGIMYAFFCHSVAGQMQSGYTCPKKNETGGHSRASMAVTLILFTPFFI